MDLLRIRETVFEHEEGKDTATITAAEQWSVNRMKKLAAEYPEEVQIYENKDGSIFAHVPWKWMRITPLPRFTEEQKEKMRERGRAAAANFRR